MYNSTHSILNTINKLMPAAGPILDYVTRAAHQVPITAHAIDLTTSWDSTGLQWLSQSHRDGNDLTRISVICLLTKAILGGTASEEQSASPTASPIIAGLIALETEIMDSTILPYIKELHSQGEAPFIVDEAWAARIPDL